MADREQDAPAKKRTALGRFKHEGASCVLAKDGRAVVYSGDDERQQFVYKFVSTATFDPKKSRAAMDFLDTGILYVARFNDDGRGRWLALVPAGKLKTWTQAEILINTRMVAKIIGATPMDRPEDIEVNPQNYRVYIVMTKDKKRNKTNGANPRSENRHGHILS